jgi:hypothetical protein
MKRRKVQKPPKSDRSTFDQSKEVRAIARERIGTVKASQTILPKAARKKPKHKKSPGDDAN